MTAGMEEHALAVGIEGVLVVVIHAPIGGEIGPDITLLVRQGKDLVVERRRRAVAELRSPLLVRGVKVLPLTRGLVQGQVVEGVWLLGVDGPGDSSAQH